MLKKIRNIVLVILVFLVLLLVLLILLSKPLEVTYFTYSSSRVPESFDEYRIVQLSDIHCKSFGKDNQKLIDQIKQLEPDLILITGDTIDAEHHDFTPLTNLFEGIQDIAPIYAISGNHEYDSGYPYQELKALYEIYGIYNLDDIEVGITRNADTIYLKGIDGINMKANWDTEFLTRKHPENFSILLDHYPQLSKLVRYEYDIIFSGHIHGGIIRIPFLGGLFGNHKELFPKYDAGAYTAHNTTMYISRGLGDAKIPRINNRPEIVCVTLKCEQ